MMNIQDYISAELAKDQFKTYDSLFWEFFELEKKPGFVFNFHRKTGCVALVYNFRKVSGAKARGIGNVNDLTIERIQNTMKELEQIEMERLKQEIKMAYRDIKNCIDTAKQEGLAEGIELGRKICMELGMNQKALDIVRNMLADGVDINLIMKYAGLTQEQIEK
jgi:hypothetical protein